MWRKNIILTHIIRHFIVMGNIILSKIGLVVLADYLEFGRFGFICRGIVWGLVSKGFSRDQEVKLINCLLVIKISRQRLLE